MCGFLGVVLSQSIKLGDEHHVALKAGLNAISRRGPDGSGTWRNDHVLLGHRRLAIIDPHSRSDQPLESKSWVLSYNGEIYNFQAIRAELKQLGQQFETSSDTEVLLLALENWGAEKTLNLVAGMFGFIAYHKPSRKAYLVRDHLGIKPVLYSRDDKGNYYAGSSVTAVKAMQPGREFQENKRALASYFALGGATTLETCYREIMRLPPAHFMTIFPDGTSEVKQYWAPRHNPDFSIDALIEIVREYEISDVKSALFLSGGVDSSFLASVFKNLDCFHLTSPEKPYAEAVAARFGLNFVEVAPGLENYEADVAAAIGFHGEPLMSVGIPLAVSREVSNQGYKMAISANGADELFLGYGRTPMPEYTPDYMPLHEPASYRFLGQQLAHIFRDSRNFEIEDLTSDLPSLRDIGMQAMQNYYLEGFPASSSYRWMELMTYVLHDLNPTLDAASMYNSLEVRVPFLDHRIVEGVLSWDSSKLVTATLGRKTPLKEVLRQYFPQSLYQRSKLGFSIHSESLKDIYQWCKQALGQAIENGFIKITSGRKYGEFGRDLNYLGNSLFGYNKWMASKAA